MSRSYLSGLFTLLVLAVAGAAGFLPDQRELAPAVSPYRSVGVIFASNGIGCGVLVGPDLFLTVSHALRNENGMHQDGRIELGRGQPEGSRFARASEVLIPQRSLEEISSGKDWAIVRLDRPLGLYYGWVPVRVLSDKEMLESTAEIAGYCNCPDDVRKEFGQFEKAYRSPCRIRNVGPHIIFHDGPMWSGTSGAPLFANINNERFLTAINSAGVSVDGEALEHGFRRTYTRELANIAIPAREWAGSFESMPKNTYAPLRKVSVRNRSIQTISVRVRFRSIFEEPGEWRLSEWIRVPSGRAVQLLGLSDGFNEQTIYLCAKAGEKYLTDVKAAFYYEQDGQSLPFHLRSMPGSADYTFSLP